MQQRASKGCWTCKARKIGCDRTLPSCQNCQRTRRQCGGYDLKLRWVQPDQPHSQQQQQSELPFTGRVFFLHTSTSDIAASCDNTPLSLSLSMRSPSIGRPIQTTTIDGLAAAPTLFSYYDAVLSRMITTIDDNDNGFRHILIPMAMQASSPRSAAGLSYVMMALSAYHSGRPQQALDYKVKALRRLSSSWTEQDKAGRLTQLATCMMLCVYDVFDASEGKWHIHLEGAKTVARTFGGLGRRSHDEHALSFLVSWLAYHDVLSEFSDLEKPSSHGISTVSLAEQLYPDASQIIGSLGCSLQVLSMISRINGLARRRRVLGHSFQDIQPEAAAIAFCLENLSQDIRTAGVAVIDEAAVKHTAELYRIAALIYLTLEVPKSTQSEEQLHSLVEKAVCVLNAMSRYTSPWPTFIVAIASQDENQRSILLNVMHVMENRRIDNISYMRQIVEEFWKLKDLDKLTGRHYGDTCRDLFKRSPILPSFI